MIDAFSLLSSPVLRTVVFALGLLLLLAMLLTTYRTGGSVAFVKLNPCFCVAIPYISLLHDIPSG
jgi:hypothetical protein